MWRNNGEIDMKDKIIKISFFELLSACFSFGFD